MAIDIDHVAQHARPSDDRNAFIAIVEPEQTTRDRIAEATARNEVAAFSSLNDLVGAALQRVSVVIILLGPSLSDQRSIDQLGVLSRIRSGVGGVLISTGMSPAIMRSALRAGLADAIALDELEFELPSVLEQLEARLSNDVVSPAASGPFRSPSERQRGRVLVVFSPKGGVGKSSISVNLATTFAKKTQGPVVLVDLDLQFGDLAVMLRLQPSQGIGEITQLEELDADFIRGLLIQHQPSGVWLLPAPTEPSAAEGVTPRIVTKLVAGLRELAPQIIIDTPPVLSEVILRVLDEADEIGFVVGMDVPSVKNARIALRALRVVGIPDERIILILNRADSKVNLAPKDVERVLGRKIDVRIPSDVIVTQSINRGIPAVLEYERSQLSRSFEQMVALLSQRADREGAR